MRIYEFHFYDPDGGRPMLDFSDCGDDGEAATEAFRALGRHGSCLGVDVYEGERLVTRVERPTGAFSPIHSALHGAE